MDRRTFMKAVCATSAGGAILFAGARPARAQSEQEAAMLQECERGSKSCRAWILDLVANAEAKLGKKETAVILESCGRSCARRGPIEAARKCQGDLDAFLKTMGGWIGAENVRREGSVVHLVYSKCYCPNVEGVEKVPAVYCECSRGWVGEMFETVLGRKVEVELLSSVKRGDGECRLVVRAQGGGG